LRTFADKLLEKLAEEIREEEDRLATGQAADWADYKSRCGTLAGWRRVKDWINDLQEV
jgi:hypothetical protein